MSETVLQIRIDMYSGRENPVVVVKGKKADELLARLKPSRKVEADAAVLPAAPVLGYRGMLVEQLGSPASGLPKAFCLAHGRLSGPRLGHWTTDEAIEDFICGSTGPFRSLKGAKSILADLPKEIARAKAIVGAWPVKPPPFPARRICPCGPIYEPAWWNVPAIQPGNNCYNYASNYRSDTFAQPGRATGHQYQQINCAEVKAGAVSDCLMDSPQANNLCPKMGHLVALVIWPPGRDFHWYRKGQNGYWSHKPGGTAVTNLDNSGHPITDPRTADRGPYTVFCTFMVAMHGHIKIK